MPYNASNCYYTSEIGLHGNYPNFNDLPNKSLGLGPLNPVRKTSIFLCAAKKIWSRRVPSHHLTI